MQDVTLATGTHATPQDGRCAMEWVSHLAGEPHSDQPRCVSPVLRVLCIALNDGLDHARRQDLRPHLTAMIATAGDGHDPARSWLALDWLARSYAPAWLALAGLDGTAQTLRRADALTGSASLAAVLPVLHTARRAARTARGRAYGAGWWAAVTDGRAARTVTWACAGSGAWAAARLMIEDPTAETARTLIRAAAGDAAAVAVRRVHPDELCGEPTPLQAAQTALSPTLDAVSQSAIALLAAMGTGGVAPAAPAPALARSLVG